MKTVRAFIAFEIPRDIVSAIVEACGQLVRVVPSARWVRPEQMHLTLLFLGDLPLSTLAALTLAMRRQLEGISPPRIALGGAGFFPNPRRARAAWIGGEAPGADFVLDGVNRACIEVGLPGGKQPWSPHLTLARLKKPWPRSAIQDFIKWGEGLKHPPFDAKEAVAFISELHPDGPVYTSFERIVLS